MLYALQKLNHRRCPNCKNDKATTAHTGGGSSPIAAVLCANSTCSHLPTWFVCISCDENKLDHKPRLFHTKSSFNRHMKSKHTEETTQASVGSSVDITCGTMPPTPKNKNHACGVSKQTERESPTTGNQFTTFLSARLSPSSRSGDDLQVDAATSPPSPLPTFSGASYTSQSMNFDREASQAFYDCQSLGRDPKKELVSKALTSGETSVATLPDATVELHMKIALLSFSLTRDQRSMLGEIIKGVSTQAVSCPENVFPTSEKCMRKYYGQYQSSITSRLPHPGVRTIEGHSYVSLREIIKDIMARGLPLLDGDPSHTNNVSQVTNNNNHVVGKVTETRRYFDILTQARKVYGGGTPLVLWISEWSDDFEPNHLKTNRGSVWLKTVTVSKPGDSPTPSEYTYPISVGHKKSDHEPVEKEFAQELASLQTQSINNMFYCGRTKKMVPVYVDIFVCMQDQPERRGACGMLAGNSNLHGRWGISCNYNDMNRQVNMCEECLLHLESTHKVPAACDQCTRWDEIWNNRECSFPAPDKYPKEGSGIDANGRLQPLLLTFDELMKATTTAREKLTSGLWLADESEAFLKRYCINDTISESLLCGAMRRRQLHLAKEIVECSGQNSEEARRVVDIYTRRPELLEDNPFPSRWTRGVGLETYIDVVMHLVFLGVVKSTNDLTQRWIKYQGKHSAFTKAASSVLTTIPRVDWCSAMDYSGDKLGGWVSENYLAFSRLLKWFFGMLECICDKNSGAEQDSLELPPMQWTKDQCVEWLECRDIDVKFIIESELPLRRIEAEKLNKSYESGKNVRKCAAALLRCAIHAFNDKDHCHKIPPRVRDKICSLGDILRMLSSLQDMISHIMLPQMGMDDIEMMNSKILIFLSRFAMVEGTMRSSNRSKKGGNKPSWLSSYNFICLLNLKNVAATFGPPRLYWEGSFMGEGFIKLIKQEISMGLRTNWQTSVILKCLKWKSLEEVCSCYFESGARSNGKDKQAVVYDNLASLLHYMNANQPISALTHGGKFVVQLEGGLQQELVRRHLVRKLGNVPYFAFEISGSPCVNRDASPNLHVGCLLLPMLGKNGIKDPGPPNGFTVVCSDWRQMDENGRLVSF